MFSKEEVEILAYQRYKSNESYEKSVWYLADLCVRININVQNGFDIKPLETDNIILMIRDDVNGQLIEPIEEEIREVAEIVYNEAPPKSQLDWFISEKLLLLREIKKAIELNRNH